MLGVPVVTVPVASGPTGMPLGVQLVGAWDRDRELLAIAHGIGARVRATGRSSGR
jgi:Asp-tRNA(Asn)/Glu-tRNA(Gln) amidotransferase A subunit family amidase